MIIVTILNFNGKDSLKASIDSVLKQSHPPDKFHVIDNASTDNSRQIAVGMNIDVIDADNKHKFITGLNTAMKLNEDILFFMQNDVVLDKCCLKRMIKNVPENLTFIAQPVIYEPSGIIDNSGMDYKWPGYGERRKTEWWNKGTEYQNCGLVTTICFMTNIKDVFWDELFSPAYYEDIDFYLRTKHDVSHILIPSAKVTHTGNHTFSQSYRKLEISRICRANRKKLIRKHYGGIDRFIRLSVTACFNVMKETIDVIRDRWISFNEKK